MVTRLLYTIATCRRRMILSALAGALMLLMPGTTALAQATIRVTGTSNQSFGTIYRSSTSDVGYESDAAARFTVIGRMNERVRLTVVKTDLTRIGGVGTAPLSLSNSDCAFSLDDGSTWTTFSTGTLYTDTRFPHGGGNNSKIQVRVGGTATAGASAARGNYQGTITLLAVYLD